MTLEQTKLCECQDHERTLLMSKIEAEKSGWLRSFMTELGIVEPASVAELEEDHREVIEAYRNGKITQAMLKGSLMNDERVSTQVEMSAAERQL